MPSASSRSRRRFVGPAVPVQFQSRMSSASPSGRMHPAALLASRRGGLVWGRLATLFSPPGPPSHLVHTAQGYQHARSSSSPIVSRRLERTAISSHAPSAHHSPADPSSASTVRVFCAAIARIIRRLFAPLDRLRRALHLPPTHIVIPFILCQNGLQARFARPEESSSGPHRFHGQYVPAAHRVPSHRLG